MPIRILVDSGNYLSNNDNLGDRAIYQVIIGRLRQIWPGCEIRWITRNANLPGLIATDLSPLVLTEDGRALLQNLLGLVMLVCGSMNLFSAVEAA